MKFSFWDILTIIIILAIAVIGGFYGLIFLNPNTSFNPFPPPTLPAAIIVPTSTATLRKLQATWTPNYEKYQATIRPTNTNTPTITSTPTITPTETETPTVTNTNTVTGTPPTETPTLTLTRTATRTQHPGTLTKVAAIAMTDSARATRNAMTQGAILTRAAMTQVAVNMTVSWQQTSGAWTASAIARRDAQTLTAAPAVTYAAALTNAAITEIAATTMAAQETQIYAAPIAYGVDTNADSTYMEQIISVLPDGSGGTTMSTAPLSDTLSPPSSWWTGGAGLWSLFFTYFTDNAGTPGDGDVYRIPANGSPGNNLLPGQPAGINRQASIWPYDGSLGGGRVVFTGYDPVNPGVKRDLWLLEGGLGGEPLIRLTSDEPYNWDDYDPAWTPANGIIFISDRSAGLGSGNIMLMNSPGAGASISAMTNYGAPFVADSPQWCRDTNTGVTRDRVAYALFDGTQWDIYIGTVTSNMIADPPTNITNTNPGDESNPSWSPYCRFVGFLSGSEIWYIDPTTMTTVQVTSDGATKYEPLWRPK